MLRRMIVKEWKEKSNLVIFALSVFVLFSVAFSAYTNDKDALDYLSSTLVLIFPAAFALLLGASGFASEFQDGAWAYLFSRPVKKWRVWLAKYVSLLTILYGVVVLFGLLIRFHPALRTAYINFDFSVMGKLSQGPLLYLLPLFFFTTAFSLSFVSDRPLHIFFLTALIWFALQMALTRGIAPILYRGRLYSAIDAIPFVFVILPVSFAVASLITLNRADFSQPRSRVWTFTKSAAIVFPAFIILLTIATLVVWKSRDERYVYDLEARIDGLYFSTNTGFFRFDVAEGKTEKIANYPAMWGDISLGGDKLAYEGYYRKGERRRFVELRIMNIDGAEERTLVGTWDQGSPLYGGYFYPIRVSPQGDRVAFVARHIPKTTPEELWLIDSDGSNLRGYDLGTLDASSYFGMKFGSSGLSIFLFISPRYEPGNNNREKGVTLMRVDLETAKATVLAERIRRPYLSALPPIRSESGADQIVYLSHDKELSRDILTILDAASLVEKRIDLDDSVTCFRLSKSGDKLAFLTSRSKLGIYSLKEQRLVKIAELTGYDLRWPSQAIDWTFDGRLVLTKIEGEKSSLCLLDTNLAEQKAYRLPFTSNKAEKVWSAGNYIIVEDTERDQLWGVDLETDKWLQIY
jgi:ABC-type transport system involved in multi-copper enzyme maturation permease subunit